MFVIILIFPLLLWAFDVAAEPTSPHKVQTERAIGSWAPKLIEAGKFKEAVSRLEEARTRTPKHPDLYFWLGIGYFKLGDDPKAEEAFKTAVALAPESFRARYNLAAVYFRQKKWEQAANTFLRVAEMSPDRKPQLHLNVGLAYYQKGETEEAVKWLEKTLNENPPLPTERAARRILALLTPAKRYPSKKSKWTIRFALMREFDSNVFLTATETQLVPAQEDWSTLGSINLTYSIPINDTVSFVPAYNLLGKWYDSQSSVNYHRNEFRLGVEAPNHPLRPAVNYAYIYTLFGNDPFLAYHRISMNSQIFRIKRIFFSTQGAWSVGNDLDAQYSYLSGYTWDMGLSATSYILKNRGYIQMSLAYQQTDFKDAFNDPSFTCTFCSYSYHAVGPSVQISAPLPLIQKLKVKGKFQYQYRTYRDADTWTVGSTQVTKRRKDHRYTFSASLLCPVFDHLEIELRYWGQINQSNLGSDPTDYVDRDHQKNLYTFTFNINY